MAQDILLIGGGALARDIVNTFGRHLFGGVFVDPGFEPPVSPCGDVFTDWAAARRQFSRFLLGVGYPAQRERLGTLAVAAGFVPAVAVVSVDARLADGVIVGEGGVVALFNAIGPGACLKNHVLVMHGCTVGHDSEIGEFSVLCPGVRIGGHARVGANCFLGPNAVISPGVRIGDHCHIAAGAVCFKDVPQGSSVIGNPGRLAQTSQSI